MMATDNFQAIQPLSCSSTIDSPVCEMEHLIVVNELANVAPLQKLGLSSLSRLTFCQTPQRHDSNKF